MTEKKFKNSKQHISFPLKKKGLKSGGISVYLCLILGVMLILIFVCIDSVRFSSGKAALSCALDESLFSVFSKYDRTLYEKYGLLFLDAGYGTDALNMGSLMDELEENCKKILNPLSTDTTPSKLYRINLNEKSITGYVLATDSLYAPLKDQICELMKVKLGADAINILSDKVTSAAADINSFSKSDEKDMDAMLEEYKAQKAAAAETGDALQESAKSNEQSETVAPADPGKVSIPDDFENPIETVSEMQTRNVYENTKRDPSSLSYLALDKNALVSQRNLKKGMGLMPAVTKSLYEKLLIGEYALDFFPDYITGDEIKDRLRYQTEYIIAGKTKDWDNLKSVLNRILLIREGFNYMYLLTSPSKMTQVHEAALIISSILLSPESEEAIAQLVTLCWAYGESLADIRVLLNGGKEPLFKSDSTWQVSLFGISRLDTKNNSEGMSYRDYLRVLLYTSSGEKVIARTADMIEYNKRISDSQPDFSLDSCLASLEVELQGTLSGHETFARGSYSYTSE